MKNDDVSSQAVTKYGIVSVPSYVLLEKHTDLNLPPSNWLKDNLAGKFASKICRKRNAIDYSSLLMADRYPSIIGEVDVISSADHIKKLLKMSVSNSSLSMSVHRFGKTLLINELDIPFLLTSEYNRNKAELKWLHDLYCNATNLPENSEFYPKKKNKEQSETLKIESKFMYYSVEDEKPVLEEESLLDKKMLPSTQEIKDEKLPMQSRIPQLEPVVCAVQQENSGSDGGGSDASSLIEKDSTLPRVSYAQQAGGLVDGMNNESYFLRDVLWTFEDITMLVGSDLPIFGGGRYPAVSLRLRDATKPISILTGIDYWLDNLMCNVPELIMCFHLKGIVQRYEQIKTSDLPKMAGSTFAPKVVKDVAQNILSFLKANCTKEGHTYWLFKSNKEDVIKLYDLTSICSEASATKRHNPFSVSVAMLLYRIARNMFSTGETSRKNITKAIKLLQHCAKLLEDENNPEITFLANYLIIELNMKLLQHSTASPEESEDELEKYNTDDEEKEAIQPSGVKDIRDTTFTTTVKTVSLSDIKTASMPVPQNNPSSGYIANFLSDEEKAKQTISHSIKALKSLEILVDRKEECSNNETNAGGENHVHPDTATTESISFKEKHKQIVNESDTEELAIIPAHKPPPPLTSSNYDNLCKELEMMKFIDSDDICSDQSNVYFNLRDRLLIRIASSYVSLVKVNFMLNKYGRMLRFVQVACHSLSCVTKEWNNYLVVVTDAFMYYGDLLTFIANRDLNIESEVNDFETKTDIDLEILSFLDEQKSKKSLYNVDVASIGGNLYKCKIDLLTTTAGLYEKGLTLIDDNDDNVQRAIDLTRRLGNVRNELGMLFMNQAAAMAKQYGEPTQKEMTLWKQSFSYYERSVQAFEIVDDKVNQALLHSNMGRLMSLCAQVYGFSTRKTIDEKRGQFSLQEKTYYHKAFEFYHKGLTCLRSEKTAPQIWESIQFQLSGAYFLMASALQDYPPLTEMAEEMVLKEISSALMKVLQHGEPVIQSQQSINGDDNTMVERIAMVHERLASLYHHALQNQLSDHGKRNYRSLAELHYKKVYGILNPNRHSEFLLRVFVLHSSLLDYVLKQNITSKNLKAKLDLFLLESNESAITLKVALRSYHGKISDNLNKNKSNLDALSKSVYLIESHLNCSLKESIKYLSSKNNKSIDWMDMNSVKCLYEIVVRSTNVKEKNIIKRILNLGDVLDKLQSIYNKDGKA